MTGKANLKKDKKGAVLSTLLCAGIGAGAALILAVLFSASILFVPEPSDFYFPAGITALYAGAAAAGYYMMKRTGVPAAALLPGAAIAALAAIAGAFVKGPGVRPVLLTVALFILVPAVSFLAAFFAGRKKKKRPSVKRRPHKRR